MSLEFYCRWSFTVAIPCRLLAVTRLIMSAPLDGANGSVILPFLLKTLTERKGPVTHSGVFFPCFLLTYFVC